MPNEVDLFLPVRPAVGLEHVVKPDREPVLAGVGLIPGIPRVDRLRLAGDQAPVDRTDVVLLEDRDAPLVPEVPGEDALVLREGADDALRVGLKLRVLRRVRELGTAGALHPARVVNARNRVMLLPEVRARIPDRIKQYEHRPDVMPRRDSEEGVDALSEPCGVLLPEKIV